MAASAAGMLFVERAKAVRERFDLTDDNAGDVGMICRVVEGLPLAVELAAARVRAMTPRGHHGPAGRVAPGAGQRPSGR